MKFLSIDTSTRYSVVSILDEAGLIYGQRRLFEKGRSEGIIGLINECLKRTKNQMEEMSGFGVGVGPGSFTGLRIGLSTIKGLSYALKKPCCAFSSLDAIAFNPALAQKTHLGVCVDAKRSNMYCQFYKIDGPSGRIKKITKESLLTSDSLPGKIGKPLLFSGDAITAYRAELKERFHDAQFAAEESWYPTPASIARLTLEQFRLNKTLDCFKLLPVYLYAQDCQVRKIC
jgi:tRNA threonylcarbamoyladenosine biosynthesis protein TsaB